MHGARALSTELHKMGESIFRLEAERAGDFILQERFDAKQTVEAETREGVVGQLVRPVLVDDGINVAEALHHVVHRILVRPVGISRGATS